jgi:chromosome segregation ATPase
MAEIMKKDHDLERQTFELSNRLRSAPKAEREKMKAELSEVVKKHFDVRQERRELQVKRMEEELKRLKEQVDARTKSRDDIIRRRITELTGEQTDAGF